MKKEQFDNLLEIVVQSGVGFTLHEHAPARTIRVLTTCATVIEVYENLPDLESEPSGK